MRRGRITAVALAMALGSAGLIPLGGCGEKIGVPQPVGLFGAHSYYREALFSQPEAAQIAIINNNLFVLLNNGKLYKRNLAYGAIDSLEGLAEPTAFCRSDDSRAELVFIWEQLAQRMTVVRSTDLAVIGTTRLPEVYGVAGMAACSTGVHVIAGARTFLYLSDPERRVVRRYDFSDAGGLQPFGLLARGGGEGARFVKHPAGLAVDAEGMLLVCDADTSRNWVIRFDPTPVLSDLSSKPGYEGPWRGLAVLFRTANCNPPALANYVIGDAATCGQTDWVGAPSAEDGEFHSPRGVALDGRGYIYVADTDNNRIQIFTRDGLYDQQFGTSGDLPAPASLGVVDVIRGAQTNYGAYIFVLLPGTGQIVKYISAEEFEDIHGEPPPS